MLDIVALGESLIDFTPSGINEMGMQLFSRNPGGAPANVLAMAARLGGKTAFVGKVGDDDFGRFLEKTMLDARIDCSGLKKDSEIPTTLAFVQLNAQGNRSFTFYRKPGADIMLEKEEVPEKLLKNCRIFHFGSVSLTDEPCRSATVFAAEKARGHGALISFDPNFRPLLWSDIPTAKKTILDIVPFADLVKVSDEEMELLTGETDLEKGSEKLCALGPKVVFVTLGPKGAYFKAPTGTGIFPAYNVKTIDTTGSGDAFWGTVLWKLTRENKPLEDISLSDWQKLTMLANAAGSLTSAKKGAIPAMPTLAQAQECVREIKPII